MSKSHDDGADEAGTSAHYGGEYRIRRADSRPMFSDSSGGNILSTSLDCDRLHYAQCEGVGVPKMHMKTCKGSYSHNWWEHDAGSYPAPTSCGPEPVCVAKCGEGSGDGPGPCTDHEGVPGWCTNSAGDVLPGGTYTETDELGTVAHQCAAVQGQTVRSPFHRSMKRNLSQVAWYLTLHVWWCSGTL
jgi:hypothetical protein